MVKVIDFETKMDKLESWLYAQLMWLVLLITMPCGQGESKVGRLIMLPKDPHIAIPGTCECKTMKKGSLKM